MIFGYGNSINKWINIGFWIQSMFQEDSVTIMNNNNVTRSMRKGFNSIIAHAEQILFNSSLSKLMLKF